MTTSLMLELRIDPVEVEEMLVANPRRMLAMPA